MKADPRQLVERYFDAFLDLANWGTRRLMFRLPAEVFALSATAVVDRYCVGDCSTAWTTGGHVIINLLDADGPAGFFSEVSTAIGILTVRLGLPDAGPKLTIEPAVASIEGATATGTAVGAPAGAVREHGQRRESDRGDGPVDRAEGQRRQ